jgi:hypothetical protein
MFIGAIIVLAGVLTQALSTTVQVFIGARVLSKLPFTRNDSDAYLYLVVGLGTAFSVNAAPLLISELSYPTHVCPITSSVISCL